MSRGLLEPWLERKTGLGPELEPKAVEAWQMARFRQLLAYVRAHSPFYRRLYQDVDGSRLRRYGDLAPLPLLCAEDLRQQGGEMLCVPQTEIQRIVTLSTSGSSGPPKRVCFSAADLELTVDFFSYGMSTMTGPDKRVMIFLPGNNPDGLCDLLTRGLRRIQAQPLVYGLVKDLPDAAAALRAFQPHCLVGMPRQMLSLAQACPELRPEVVLFSAENVHEPMRQALAQLWPARVLANWAMTETGYGAGLECRPAGGYHLRHGDLLVEIIDPESGRPLPPGQQGEIVFTTLTREAMPLLRYRSGDFARMIAEPCPCGSALFRLGPVLGHDKY